jgi:hypothetical protein
VYSPENMFPLMQWFTKVSGSRTLLISKTRSHAVFELCLKVTWLTSPCGCHNDAETCRDIFCMTVFFTECAFVKRRRDMFKSLT